MEKPEEDKFEEDMTLSKGSFQAGVNKSEHFDSPKGIEEQEPDQSRAPLEIPEQIASPKSNFEEVHEQEVHEEQAEGGMEVDDFDSKLNTFESNTSLNLSTNLKGVREQLFIASRRLQDQKLLYETLLADRARCVEGLEYELQKADQEKEHLRRRYNDLNFEFEAMKQTFEKKIEETSAKLSEYEKERIKVVLTQNELTRVRMENDMSKVTLETLQRDMNKFKQENQRLENENQELQRIVNENGNTYQSNQSLMLNLGVPAYRAQLDLTIEDFNSLNINLEGFNLDKNTVYEFCNLLLRKAKDLRAKLKYYEDNQFEERMNQAIEENLKLKEDVIILENTRNNLIELNKDLEVRNSELSDYGFQTGRLNEILVQKDTEIKLKDDTLIKKDKIITELERLIDIYESQIYTKEHLKGNEQMEEELPGGESKETILNRYNKLKQEWTLLMRDYKDLRQVVIEYQQKDPNNADKYEENFLNSLIRENNHLKELNKLKEEECRKYYEHAVEKVQQYKDIARNLLGWEIRVKDEIVEMRNILSEGEHDVLVLKEIEEKRYEILDVDDFARRLFNAHPYLTELKNTSYPLFFASVSVLMKPEVKELFFIL